MRTLPLLSLLLLAACPAPSDDDGDTDVGDTDDTDVGDTDLPPWETVAEHLGGALLSVTGTSATDVWTVGAEDDDGPTVLHYDGAAWARIPAPAGGDLWWGWRPPGTTDVLWTVGANGRALRWNGSTWEGGVVVDGAEGLSLFGIWGASEDDVWAVGGNIAASADAAALFRRQGGTWSRVDLPAGAASKSSLYKVWGTAADDVWVCGMGGTLAHFDGDTWTDAGGDVTTRTLLTLTGTGPDAVWAVGGVGTGTIVHWDGDAWTDESPDFAPDFNGVSARGDAVVAVGMAGWAWRRGADGAWFQDPRGRAATRDLHAVWIDPDGGEWAVGGQITALPLTEGVLVHAGADVPSWAP